MKNSIDLRPARMVVVLSLVLAGICRADEWTDYIRVLERSSAQTKKEKLPRAYRNYAHELFRKEPEAAFRYMEKAVALDSQYRSGFAELLYVRAVMMVNDRQDNDSQSREARRLAERALTYDKSLAKAHVLIGNIAYDNQDLNTAKLSWKRALSFEPNNSSIKKKLANIETESSVEKSFHRESYSFFDVRYQDGVDPSAASNLRKYLDQVRKEVGQDFRYYPRHKLIVLVYSQDGFDRIVAGRGPGWWAAFYDGKIRVPISRSGLRELKPTLVHEYTHALVHDLGGGYCPKWLNEGLAEYEEAKIRMPRLFLLRLAVERDRLLPLTELNDALVDSDHATGALAYQQSYSLVKYIKAKYGFSRLTRVLERLAQGTSIDKAIQSELGVSLFQLEEDWKVWVPNLVR